MKYTIYGDEKGYAILTSLLGFSLTKRLSFVILCLPMPR